MSPAPIRTNMILYETDDNDEVCANVVNTIDSFLQNENNISIWRANILYAQISLPQIQNARIKIINFFENNLQATCFGTSSNGYTGHYLFRKNNKIYVFYYRIGGSHFAHNFTRDFMMEFFREYTSNGLIELNNVPTYFD